MEQNIEFDILNSKEKMEQNIFSGQVKEGDHIIFTDAWHPGITNIKYMSELLGVKVITHALWHAGSYDPQDFLGRLIGNASWVRHAEKSFFHSYDHNYFATDFHVKLFFDELLLALYTPRGIYVYLHDQKYGVTTSGLKTADSGNAIHVVGPAAKADWSTSLDAMLDKLDRSGCMRLAFLPWV